MIWNRRALSALPAALIAVLGVIFLSTVAMACDDRPSVDPPAAMAMSSDPGSCPDTPDIDCRKVCRVLGHGLVVPPSERCRPTSFVLLRYWDVATDEESIPPETEDPPPRA